MPDPISPALTPDEWQRRVVDRPPRAITAHDGVLTVHGVGTSVQIPDELRHPLAALCLHGQPYGFSQADLRSLEAIYRWVIADPRNLGPVADDVERVYDLADRITALLSRE